MSWFGECPRGVSKNDHEAMNLVDWVHPLNGRWCCFDRRLFEEMQKALGPPGGWSDIYYARARAFDRDEEE